MSPNGRDYFPHETISCGGWPDNADTGMNIVEESGGFKVGMVVKFAEFGGASEKVQGTILAIGENAKQDDSDEIFTAFAIRMPDSGIIYKTHRDIHHVI